MEGNTAEDCNLLYVWLTIGVIELLVWKLVMYSYLSLSFFLLHNFVLSLSIVALSDHALQLEFRRWNKFCLVTSLLLQILKTGIFIQKRIQEYNQCSFASMPLSFQLYKQFKYKLFKCDLIKYCSRMFIWLCFNFLFIS